MLNRKITLNCVLSTLCWIIGIVLLAVDLIESTDDIGHIGLAFVGTAILLHVRALVMQLADAQRNAFALGHDAGMLLREETSVRPFR